MADFAFSDKKRYIVSSTRVPERHSDKHVSYTKVEAVHDNKDDARKHARRLRNQYKTDAEKPNVDIMPSDFSGADKSLSRVGKTTKFTQSYGASGRKETKEDLD